MNIEAIIMPEGPRSLHEQGVRHQFHGEFDEAHACFEGALAAAPDHPHTQLALAQLRMMKSMFREGREGYEARFAASGEGDFRHLPILRWRGESLAGKRLYLWAEQGFGDVIMFAGFLPYLLAQSPANITLGVFPKMMPLLARSFPQVTVESLDEALALALAPALLEIYPQMEALARNVGAQIPDALQRDYQRALARGTFDFAAPIGDLMVYGLSDYIPAQHPPYLRASPAQPVGSEGRKIGISWHTPDTTDGHIRTIAPQQWASILNIPGCRFFSLQHHAPAEDMAQFGTSVIAPEFEPAQDTEGLASLIASMDEVITIDNSNAHLAGALGVPTTLLLPKGCNFRWPETGQGDTLWYRSVRVQRQAEFMDWRPVMARTAAELQRRRFPSG